MTLGMIYIMFNHVQVIGMLMILLGLYACTPKKVDEEPLTPERLAALEKREAEFMQKREAYIKQHGHPKFDPRRFTSNMTPMVKAPENQTKTNQ